MASEIKVVKFLNGVKVEIDHGGAAVDILLKKLKTKESQSNIDGEDAVLPSPDSSFVLLDNPDLVSIEQINPVTDFELLIIHNATGRAVTFKRSGNILTGSEEDLVLETGASILLYNIQSLAKYAVIGGSGSGGGSKKTLGSMATPILFQAGQSIPFDGFQDILIIICQSDGGAINLSAVNPQIANGKKVNQEVWLLSTSAVDTFQLGNGNGLIMKAPYLSDLYSLNKFLWLGETNGWVDITR